jgi:flagellar basal-body rod protein FlgF
MENPYLVGLSRQVALERQMAVIANNVANMNTTGFKADKPLFEEFLMPEARANEFKGRDRLISFVQDRATYHDFAQGPVQQTGNPLDVALDGDAFLVVQTPAGERYTRNGSLKLNPQGQLVTSDGYAVVGESGPITFQSQDQAITIARDGSITVREGENSQADSARGKLRIVNFDAPARLQKQGASLFSAPDGVAPQPAPLAGLRQGMIEKSNVNAVVEMGRMVEVMRTYQSVATMLQQQGDLRRTAIERLAEVPL